MMRGRKKKIPGAVEQTKPEPFVKKLKPKPVISVEPQDEFVNRLNH